MVKFRGTKRTVVARGREERGNTELLSNETRMQDKSPGAQLHNSVNLTLLSYTLKNQ